MIDKGGVVVDGPGQPADALHLRDGRQAELAMACAVGAKQRPCTLASFA
jgi:hypothetical protein